MNTMLDIFSVEEDNFFQRLVTVDKCWVYFYSPKIEFRANNGAIPNCYHPKKVKKVPSVGKLMLTVL